MDFTVHIWLFNHNYIGIWKTSSNAIQSIDESIRNYIEMYINDCYLIHTIPQGQVWFVCDTQMNIMMVIQQIFAASRSCQWNLNVERSFAIGSVYLTPLMHCRQSNSLRRWLSLLTSRSFVNSYQPSSSVTWFNYNKIPLITPSFLTKNLNEILKN